MASCMEWHKELNRAGIGKCSVPMWVYPGVPAGFCDKPAYGIPDGTGRMRYDGYVPKLACYGHGGPDGLVDPEQYIDIVFDGPPGPESGRFVEVESPPGTSIRLGVWIELDGGLWALRVRKDDLAVEPEKESLEMSSDV